MRAMSGTAIKSDDPEGGTAFVLAENAYHTGIEQPVLQLMQKRLQDEDIGEAEMKNIEDFCNLVKARRQKFASCIEARKARAAAVIK